MLVYTRLNKSLCQQTSFTAGSEANLAFNCRTRLKHVANLVYVCRTRLKHVAPCRSTQPSRMDWWWLRPWASVSVDREYPGLNWWQIRISLDVGLTQEMVYQFFSSIIIWYNKSLLSSKRTNCWDKRNVKQIEYIFILSFPITMNRRQNFHFFRFSSVLRRLISATDI